MAIISTYSSDDKQETIGYVQNGDKFEILPHPSANKEISMQAIWIPGYNHVGTYTLDDICYVVTTGCVGVFLVTLADPLPVVDEAIVGTACGTVTVGCWAVDTVVRYSPCGNPSVELYARSWWNPIGPDYMAYPIC